jgi:hypothetical protein
LGFFHMFICFHYSACLSSILSISYHYSTCLSSIFSISFHISTYLSSIFSISFHYSTYFSSVFSKSFHYSIRVITKLPNSEQSYKGKVKTQSKSVNNRETVKTVMTLTWYRHF